MLSKRIKQFSNRPDVQKNIFKALLKRWQWRMHWVFNQKPITADFSQNLKIHLPKTGSASLIYYQGFSEPNTAEFMQRFLKPGMVMMDVGAHLGEYTLLAAENVGKTGQVHAFEPQANLFPVVEKNVKNNNFNNVTVNCAAISEQVGEVEFAVCAEPSVSSIRKANSFQKGTKIVKVPSTSLEAYWHDQDKPINLIKVDVEGAEKFVFAGAEKFMALGHQQAPTWIFEYAPRAYRKFNYQAQELLQLIHNYGYQVFTYTGSGKVKDFNPQSPSSGIVNLIAAKNKNYLLSLIQAH